MRVLVQSLLLCCLTIASATAQVTIRPTTLIDSGHDDIAGGATFFFVQQINGQAIRNAYQRSKQASIGAGFGLYMIGAERILHPGVVKLKLKASRTAGAPLTSIFRALTQGSEPDIEGEVEVKLAPQTTYYITGKFDGLSTGVWLVDEQGEELLGSRVKGPEKPDLAKTMEGAVFAATNLRREGDWIGESPVLERPFIPAGTLIKVGDFRSGDVKVLVDGVKMNIGFYEKSKTETIQQLVERHVSAESPATVMAGFPPLTQRAIRIGRVMLGMTREQVRLSLGRPALDKVPNLAASEWRYAYSETQEFAVLFDEQGLAKEFKAPAPVLKTLIFSPNK
jgi:SmpA / OmlA family